MRRPKVPRCLTVGTLAFWRSAVVSRVIKVLRQGAYWCCVGTLMFLVALKTLGFERYGAFEWLM